MAGPDVTVAPPRYRRLARRSALVGITRDSLWLGPDHLLLVNAQTFVETYRRFYFRDIRSIVVERTRNWHAISAAAGILVLFLAVLAVLLGEPAPIIMGILAGVVVLGLLLHLAKGPSCRCRIETVAGASRLKAVSRLRRARRILRRIAGPIAAAQPPLTEAELAAPAPVAAPLAGAEPPPGPSAVPLPVVAPGRMYPTLFGALLAGGAVALAHLGVGGLGLSIAGAVLLLVALGFAIACVAQARRVAARVRMLARLALALLILRISAAYMILSYTGAHAGSGWWQLRTDLAAPGATSIPRLVFGLVLGLLSVGLGVAGLAVTAGERNRIGAAAARAEAGGA